MLFPSELIQQGNKFINMPTRNQRRRSGRKNAIINVRSVDSFGGSDGLMVDRQLSNVKQSESQTRILIGDVVDLDIASTDTFGVWDFNTLYGTDDFTSMIQQYRMFRVKSIKFVVYDINAGSVARNVFATFHDDYTGSVPVFTRANITDQPDSQVISVGTGQTTFYWVAHGVEENRFQSATSAGALANKFGGLRYFFSNGTVGAKYTLEVHAVVDFRGRA